LTHLRKNERNFKEETALKKVPADSTVPFRNALFSTFKASFYTITIWCFLSELLAILSITWTIALISFVIDPESSGWRGFFFVAIFILLAACHLIFRNLFIF